jgi:hypothetical protein
MTDAAKEEIVSADLVLGREKWIERSIALLVRSGARPFCQFAIFSMIRQQSSGWVSLEANQSSSWESEMSHSVAVQGLWYCIT